MLIGSMVIAWAMIPGMNNVSNAASSPTKLVNNNKKKIHKKKNWL